MPLGGACAVIEQRLYDLLAAAVIEGDEVLVPAAKLGKYPLRH